MDNELRVDARPLSGRLTARCGRFCQRGRQRVNAGEIASGTSLRWVSLGFVALLVSDPVSHPAVAQTPITSTATTGVSANWTALSWDNGIPGGQAGDVANANSSASVTITINQPLTLRTLNHTQTAGANVIFNASGGSTVTFDSGQVGTNASLFFTRSNGDSLTMKLNAPIVLNSTLDAAWGRVQNREMGFGGVISGVGGLNVNYASVALNGVGHIFRFGDQSTASPNTYSGGTSLTTRNSTFSTVRFQAYKAGAFGTGPLNLTTAAVDLQNFDQTIGGLGGGAGASKISSLSNTAGTTTLTIDFPSTAGSFSYSGAIQAGGSARIVAVTKTGTGTQTLSGTNTYTGGTSINGGTLLLGSAASLPTAGAVSLNGGVLNLGGFSPSVSAVTLTSGTISNGTLTGTSYNFSAGIVSASLSGSASLLKSTGGTVGLSGVNTYSGGTTVNGGTLTVTAANALGTGRVTVASGARLRLDVSPVLGGGSEISLLSGAEFVTAGSVSAPLATGSSLSGWSSTSAGGTAASLLQSTALTATTFSTGWDTNPGDYLSDILTLSGTTAGVSNVMVLSMAYDPAYSGALTDLNMFTRPDSLGTFAAVGSSFEGVGVPWTASFQTPGQYGVSDGRVWAVTTTSSQFVVDVSIVPEPGSFVLAACGVAAAGFWFRRCGPAR